MYKTLYKKYKDGLLSKENLLNAFEFLLYDASTYKDSYCILGLMIKLIKPTKEWLEFMEEYFLSRVTGTGFRFFSTQTSRQYVKFVLFCIKVKWD